jgi:phage-related protein
MEGGIVYLIHLYQTSGGECPVRRFIEELPEKDQAKVGGALDYLSLQGPALRRPHAAHVRGKLWELRVSLGRKEYRLIYFFTRGQLVVVAHAFAKKTQAITAREIEVAERRMWDYEDRIRKGEVDL